MKPKSQNNFDGDDDDDNNDDDDDDDDDAYQVPINQSSRAVCRNQWSSVQLREDIPPNQHIQLHHHHHHHHHQHLHYLDYDRDIFLESPGQGTTLDH